MNRIDRLAAILIQMQSRRLVRAQEIADKFSISLRTVYRDVKALEEGGVPIIGEAGSGYKLMDGYKLPPVMFNQEEATALLTASKLVESKTDAGMIKHYTAALDKIRAILRHSEKDHIEDIDDHIAVMNHPAIAYSPQSELYLQPILNAISSSDVIEINYTTLEKNEVTKRQLEPVGIYYMGSHWYLIAWCRLRNDYRNFRTDKIGQLKTIGEKVSKTHPPLQSFIDKMSDDREVTKVVIDVDAALKALHKEGLLDDTNITIYFTGDEENAAHPRSISRGDFIERAKQHDIALAFETAQALGTVATARRGASEWRLEVEAKQAHSSGVFGTAGYGAIYEASRIINEFRVKLSSEKFLTFNPGLFVGGSEVNYDTAAQKGDVLGKTNIISPKAVVIGDLRFLSEAQKEKARAAMRQIVSKNLNGAKATIRFKDGIPSMPPTPGNEALVKTANSISLALGYGIVKAGDPGSRGAGDISYIAKYLDCLDGLGAPGKGAHAPGEIINLNEYPKLLKRAALLIYRLTR